MVNYVSGVRSNGTAWLDARASWLFSFIPTKGRVVEGHQKRRGTVMVRLLDLIAVEWHFIVTVKQLCR